MSWSTTRPCDELRKFHQLRDDDPIFDNPTGATLTTGSIARLAAASAQTLAKYESMSAQVEVLNAKLDELRAGLDRLQAHQRDEAITKAASAAFREAQQ